MDPIIDERIGQTETSSILRAYFSTTSQVDQLRPDLMERYLSESLRAVVKRAYEGSDFYREKMSRAGVTPEDIKGPADLAAFPFLTKDETRMSPWMLLTCDREDVSVIQCSTGTSGGEVSYLMATTRDYMNDLTPRYSSLFGIGPGDICLNALPYEMSNAGLGIHRTFMESYGVTVISAGKGGVYSTPSRTIKAVKDLRPTVAITSPSWAITLAEEAQQSSFDLTGLQLKKMWLTGEGCSRALRRRIEQLWGTRAHFIYGSSEGGVLGVECEEQDGYHLTQAHSLMEVVDPRTLEVVGAGEIGEIVVTMLLREHSPILRFRTGDLGCLDTAPCPCGTTLPRFHLKGRVSEQIEFQGRRLSPYFLEEILLGMPEVGNWFSFVVPGSDGGRIKVRFELSRGAQPAEGLTDALAGKMASATGLPFEFEIVDEMPRPTSKAVRVVRG